VSSVLTHPLGRVSLHPEVPLAHRHLLEVVAVAEPDELVQAAVLLGEYRAWAESALGGALGDHQPEAHGEYAAPAAYYAEPDGVLLLARLDGEPVGVMGVRLNEPELAELKRGYVRKSARGRGVVRALLSRGISTACALGARRVFFETSPRHSRPVFELARSLGFDQRAAEEFSDIEGSVRMELTLDCVAHR
jgi:GNAT superfamily N-acetyltransferase